MSEILISGWLMGVAIALPVGPVITELIRRGLSGGFLQGWLVGLGAAASHVILVTLTLLGVVAFFDGPVWRVLLGFGGVVVLGYLGMDAFRAGAMPPSVGAADATRHPFLVGFSIGIANPITLLWFLTVGGALMPATLRDTGAGWRWRSGRASWSVSSVGTPSSPPWPGPAVAGWGPARSGRST